MRVISGSAKGHMLFAPVNLPARPTTGNVREALFNVLFNVNGYAFLDLFAGTGAVGIEALSRGAESAVFVDISPECINIIKRNVEKTNFTAKSEIIRSDAMSALKALSAKGRSFDIIYIDPPYDMTGEALIEILLSLKCNNLINKDGLCVIERRKNASDFDYTRTGFILTKKKVYSNAQLLFIAVNTVM